MSDHKPIHAAEKFLFTPPNSPLPIDFPRCKSVRCMDQPSDRENKTKQKAVI